MANNAIGGTRNPRCQTAEVRRLTQLALTLACIGPAAIGPRSVEAQVSADMSLEPAVDRVECAAQLSIEEQAGQTLVGLISNSSQVADVKMMLGNRQLSGIAPVGDFVAEANVGVDFFRQLTADLASSDVPGLFASDEEGGPVQRFDELIWPLPSARRQVESMTLAEVSQMYSDYGAGLAAFDVSMAFAPVVDVGDGPAIGSRSYGSDPDVVIEYAGAAIAGYLDAGVTPVLKHFPGHGRASADTHDGAATTPPLDELRATDLAPYEAMLSDDVGVMVGHLDVPGLTDGRPASLSRAAINGLLRTELGFDGLVVSDALGMGAIRQVATGPDAAVLFLQAGGDLALVDAVDASDAHAAIVAAVTSGRLEPFRLHQAVTHVLRVKDVEGDCATPWGLIATASVRGALLARSV